MLCHQHRCRLTRIVLLGFIIMFLDVVVVVVAFSILEKNIYEVNQFRIRERKIRQMGYQMLTNVKERSGRRVCVGEQMSPLHVS